MSAIVIPRRGQLVVDSGHEFQAMGQGPLWACRYRV